MCEVRESEVPLYTFTYKPSKQDIKRAAAVLNSRRRWTDNRTNLIFQGTLTFLSVAAVILIAVFAGQELWSNGASVGAIVFLLLHSAAELVAVFLGVYWPDCVRDYMRDRAAYADRLQAYFFYNDRVEIEGPLGHLTHAYTAYDRLVLTPDLFFLVIFEYRGEHLPWSVVPAEERDGFKAFLLERAAVYNVPVEDREKTARRNSK